MVSIQAVLTFQAHSAYSGFTTIVDNYCGAHKQTEQGGRLKLMPTVGPRQPALRPSVVGRPLSMMPPTPVTGRLLRVVVAPPSPGRVGGCATTNRAPTATSVGRSRSARLGAIAPPTLVDAARRARQARPDTHIQPYNVWLFLTLPLML